MAMDDHTGKVHRVPEGVDIRDYAAQMGARDMGRNVLKQIGQLWGAAVERLEIRKRAMEMAVAACGPQNPSDGPASITDKITRVADGLEKHMLKDAPRQGVVVDWPPPSVPITCTMTPAPGWRFRIDQRGVIHHEKDPG